MKRNLKSKFLVFFVLVSLSFLSSCYTNKRGVVPCPSWGQVEQEQNMPEKNIG